jgi:hypothetical protein
LADGAPNMKLVVEKPLGGFRGMVWRLDAGLAGPIQPWDDL